MESTARRHTATMKIKTISRAPVYLPLPLTFRGVAVVAQLFPWRFWMVETVVALCAALSVGWFIQSDWLPVVGSAIVSLPERSRIESGALVGFGQKAVRLAGNDYLAVTVVPSFSNGLGQTSDVQIEFHPTECRIGSLLGYCALPYPQGWVFELNRAELEPWWGAWYPVLVAGAGLGTLLVVNLAWWLLALLYLKPVRWIARAAGIYPHNRILWHLAVASQIPGALFLSAALILYGWNLIPLAGFLFAFLLHFVIAWPYLLMSPLFLSKSTAISSPGKSPKNPFGR